MCTSKETGCLMPLFISNITSYEYCFKLFGKSKEILFFEILNSCNSFNIGFGKELIRQKYF